AMPDGPCDFLGLVADYEKVLLRNALERNQFHQKRAAADLGLNYHQFRGYLRKYGLLERRHGPREADDGDEGDEG
ncbi:MAG: phage shock protein operon transcriptional activator, partial [Niveispirillum sp.]|nr:phage shock protein operon transcriptional activator [Niveispirillum sp.]